MSRMSAPSDKAVELRHHPLCSQGLMVGGDCTCEPEAWVRLRDVVEALRNEQQNGPGWATFIEREFAEARPSHAEPTTDKPGPEGP